MNFETLGLRTELLRAMTSLGFQTPMPIQAQAIPILLSGKKDFVGLAQTGTGKTAAFGLPLIQHIDQTLARPQAVIMCPTRELCLQITNDLKQFARHLKKVRIAAVYGGASIAMQIAQLKKGAQIIVATPGRLLDLINRKAVKLAQVAYAVLDEADEMLNMGFQEDIDQILSNITGHRHIWLFSATMPKGVAKIARQYLSDPEYVTVGKPNSSPKNIQHRCYVIHEKNRYLGLKRLIDFAPEMFGLVFCRTRQETRDVAEALLQDGYQAEALHGELSQSQRDYVMRKFRQKSIHILVATDVAARGLDVDNITHVIHYNLPGEAETYTHRSGRTARAGKAGCSIALINKKEIRRVRELEYKRNLRFEFCKIPNGRSICEKQLASLMDRIVQTDVNHTEINEYLPAVYAKLADIDKEELIKRFVSAEFNRFLTDYHHAEDINVKNDPKRKAPFKSEKKIRPRRKKTQRFSINVGRRDNINPGAIVRMICDNSGIRSNLIGAIDLNRKSSFFEVAQSAAAQVRNSVKNATLDGRHVQVREVFADKRYQRSASRY